MAKPLRPKRGTTAKNNAFVGLVAEITVDTDKKTIRVHDGVTAGGNALATDADLATVRTTANNAASAASTAQTTANNAASAASTAQSTANSAATAASNAQSTANSAQTTANNALPKSYVTYGTADKTAGSSALTTGSIYLMYE